MPDPVVAPAAAPAAAGEPITPGAPITATWRESYEDPDIKGATTLDKFKGKDDREILAAVSKGYVNLEKMPRGVTVPKDGAPQAEWDAFYEKAGRPKTVDEYGIDLKVPEGMVWSKEAERRMLQGAHEVGLNKKQAEGLLNKYLAIAKEGNDRISAGVAQDAEAAYEEIRKDWGGLTERNTALVQRCVTEFGGEELKTYLDESGLGNDPRFLKFVFKMGSPMVESNLIKGDNLGMRKNEAQAEITRLMADAKWAKGDAVINARIAELYPIANAE